MSGAKVGIRYVENAEIIVPNNKAHAFTSKHKEKCVDHTACRHGSKDKHT